MIQREELIEIGYFTKPHGVKGEIGVSTSDDLFGKKGKHYLIVEIDGIFVPFFLESVRPKGKGKLVKLERVDDEETVRQFSHRTVYMPIHLVEEEEINESCLRRYIGYLLIDQKEGEIGAITDIDESTMNVLLQVDYQGEELLVPFHKSMICDEDKSARTLLVELPEGLLSL